MQVIDGVAEIQAELQKLEVQGKTIGFVPTMGAIHKGHLSLIERSTNENDITICSIFINPIQFNNQNDLDNYPRTLEVDKQILSDANCDYLFCPSYEEMYPGEIPEPIQLNALATVMEGSYRQGHFDGVTIVVRRFFEILKPTRAYFGLKDYQQYSVVKYMTKMLALPVEIIGCETLRSEGGLALSSRNQLLDETGINAALIFNKSLHLAKLMMKTSTVEEINNAVAALFDKEKDCRIDYFELADAHNLMPVSDLSKHPSVVALIAGYVGEVRLIDNLILIP